MSARTWFEIELAAQPEALSRLLRDERAAVDEVADAIRAFQPRFAMIAGRGSSYNAACYASYVLSTRHGLAVALASPSMFTRYEAPPDLAGALVVGISQSGRASDILTVVQTARRQDALTVAITNDAGSPLAEAADLHITLRAGDERSVAATKTYTSQLFAVAMLSAGLDSGAGAWEELAAIPEQVAARIALGEDVGAVVAALGDAQRLSVIGRGFNYPTALEVALKIKEMTYVMAEPSSPVALLHGPVAMLDATLPLIAVAPSGRVADDVAALMDVVRQRQVPLVVISDRDDLLESAVAPLRLPRGTPEWLSPIVAVVPGQQCALALALARGGDPDRPRGLAKVTVTR